MTDHCTRTDILRWARSGKVDSRAEEHLSVCAQCRGLYELASAFAGAEKVILTAAPSGWVERAIALARKQRLASRLADVAAKLVFDSWSAPAYAGLRGRRDAEARRLMWQAGEWTLELRAEASPAGSWECVAQVQKAGEVVRGAVLQFESDRVHTDAAGMAIWNGKRPPRSITLHAEEGSVEFGRLTWVPPKRT